MCGLLISILRIGRATGARSNIEKEGMQSAHSAFDPAINSILFPVSQFLLNLYKWLHISDFYDINIFSIIV